MITVEILEIIYANIFKDMQAHGRRTYHSVCANADRRNRGEIRPAPLPIGPPPQ